MKRAQSEISRSKSKARAEAVKSSADPAPVAAPAPKYMYIECTNCGPTNRPRSRGGFTNPGRLAAVEPMCLFCNGNHQLILCYNCNAVHRYTGGPGYPIEGTPARCDGCKLVLATCERHTWNLIDLARHIYQCEGCQVKGSPHPKGNVCDVHSFQLNSVGEFECSKCKVPGEI
jgi:hypothetical protein